jgi:hypothetical protein
MAPKKQKKTKKKTYGTTRSGRTVDDDLVDELAAVRGLLRFARSSTRRPAWPSSAGRRLQQPCPISCALSATRTLH